MSDSVLAIDADVSISAGAATGHLGGSGSSLVFEVTNLTPFISSSGSRSSLNAMADRLAYAGVTINLTENGRAVAELGAVERSWFARLFGLRNLHLRRPLLLLRRYLTG